MNGYRQGVQLEAKLSFEKLNSFNLIISVTFQFSHSQAHINLDIKECVSSGISRNDVALTYIYSLEKKVEGVGLQVSVNR